MAVYNKFQPFLEYAFEKAVNLGSDTLKVMLTNAAPSAANGLKADLTEISSGSGYTSGGTAATISSSAQSSGTYKLVLADVVFTASGGTIGPFRYAVLYDDTSTSDVLIGWWDYGSSVTLQDGESFTWDADPSTGVLQAA